MGGPSWDGWSSVFFMSVLRTTPALRNSVPAVGSRRFHFPLQRPLGVTVYPCQVHSRVVVQARLLPSGPAGEPSAQLAPDTVCHSLCPPGRPATPTTIL